MVKMVSHRELIALIVQQLNKFNPENQSVEDFLNESAMMLQVFDLLVRFTQLTLLLCDFKCKGICFLTCCCNLH